MIESIYLEAFFSHLLGGDTLLTGADALNSAGRADKLIFKGHARQGAPFPLIIFSLLAATDFRAMNKERLIAEFLYMVKIIGRVEGVDLQDAPRVRATANRMDDLLKEVRDRTFTVEGVTFRFNTWRKQELPRLPEQGIGDEFYLTYGGIYVAQVYQ